LQQHHRSRWLAVVVDLGIGGVDDCQGGEGWVRVRDDLGGRS